MKFLLSLLLVVASAVMAPAFADDQKGWLQDGNPVAGTDSRKTVSGFGASLIITADPDWESEWDTPSEIVPMFSSVENLKRGEQADILVFFTNPALDAAGEVDVTYDLKITGPDKRVTENPGLKGFAGPLAGPPANTYLAGNIIRFVGEPADPLGEWVVDVVVHDRHRRVSIPLRARFTLTLTGDEQVAIRETRFFPVFPGR